MTYTYVLLDVSPACYHEIREKLEAAGYSHAVHKVDGDERIDMHGIALVSEEANVATVDSEHAEAAMSGLEDKGSVKLDIDFGGQDLAAEFADRLNVNRNPLETLIPAGEREIVVSYTFAGAMVREAKGE